MRRARRFRGGFDSLVALFKRHVFLTICFSPDDDPERKLELVLSERVASRLGQALASGSVGLMQEFNFSVGIPNNSGGSKFGHRCDSPIFIEGKIEAKHNRGKVSLRIGLPPCPHHGPVRLRLSTRQSAGASPQSPAPELLGT